MAVRRQLRELSRDPQLDGVIIVERPSCPAAATRVPKPLRPTAAFATRVYKPPRSDTAFATRVRKPPRYAAAFATRVRKPPRYAAAFATRVHKPSSSDAAFATRVHKPSSSDAAFATGVHKPSSSAAAFATRVHKPSSSAAAFATRVHKPSSSAAAFATRVYKPSSSDAAFATRVHKPSCPGAATRVSEASVPARGVLPPSRSSTPSLLLRQRAPLPEECAMFQCCGCRAVLGDSLHLCAQEPRLGVLVCFKVTNGVTWEESLVIGLEGFPLGCACYSLSCQSCGWIVGFILYSATRDLAHLRGFFCLFKDRILCYLLKKQITIEATNINFPALTLNGRIQKLKQKIVDVYIRIEMLIKKVEKMCNMAENQSFALEASGLPPGYVVVKVN